jgi:hypothetical protein
MCERNLRPGNMQPYQADVFSRLHACVKKVPGLLAIGAHGTAFTVHVKSPFRETNALFNEQDVRFHVGVLVSLEAKRVDGSCVSNCCWCHPRFGCGFADICGQGACTCDI